MKSLQEIIDGAKRLVFFGGAGVSTESGIPDFRSVDGLYNQRYAYPPETILSHSFFEVRPAEFFEFYRDRMLFPNAKPNKAHTWLAKFEETGRLTGVVTQNIDGLHQAAGSRRVFELHGSVHRNYCMDCGKFFPMETILHSSGIPRCECGGVVKPDVVLYGEPLDAPTWRGAMRVTAMADVLIVAGTSLSVSPAAELVGNFDGRELVLINREPTTLDPRATLVVRGNVAEVMGNLEISES